MEVEGANVIQSSLFIYYIYFKKFLININRRTTSTAQVLASRNMRSVIIIIAMAAFLGQTIAQEGVSDEAAPLSLTRTLKSRYLLNLTF